MSVQGENIRVGWIGTGVMGLSMCGHLIEAEYPAVVYSRTKARAEPLLEKGATWANSPREVSAASDVVFTIVGYPADVRSVVLGDEGVLAGAASGSVLVEMTTSEPSLAVEIAERAAEKGVAAIDAPVSGGDVGARNATLSIMVGGDSEAVERVRPLLEVMGKTIVHLGPAGAGQHTKMVNQILIATGMIGISEALLYAYKSGLDLESTLEAVSGGAAGSWSLSNYGPRMLQGDFEPGFMVEHFVKDMAIALEEGRTMELSMPGLALAKELYVADQAQGRSRKGTHSLILALAQLSNIDWDPPTDD